MDLRSASPSAWVLSYRGPLCQPLPGSLAEMRSSISISVRPQSWFTFLCLGRLSLGNSITARAHRLAGLFHCQKICARLLSPGGRLWFSSVGQWVILRDECYPHYP